MAILERVRAEILSLLLVDRKVSSEDVQVFLHESAIFVTGTVDSKVKVDALRQILRPYRNVCILRDQVIVNETYYRPDEEIFFSCKRFLQRLELETGEKILVQVSDGIILFTGRVFHGDKKTNVGLMCEKLSGVKYFQNLIQVKSPESGSLPMEISSFQ